MQRLDEHDLFTPAPLPVAELDPEQRLACLRLIRSDNVGPVTFRELVNHYGGAVQALDALPELARRGGRTIRICPAGRAEQELDRCEASPPIRSWPRHFPPRRLFWLSAGERPPRRSLAARRCSSSPRADNAGLPQVRRDGKCRPVRSPLHMRQPGGPCPGRQARTK